MVGVENARGAGRWVLGAGCWVLGDGCRVMGDGCWVLGAWVLGTTSPRLPDTGRQGGGGGEMGKCHTHFTWFLL